MTKSASTSTPSLTRRMALATGAGALAMPALIGRATPVRAAAPMLGVSAPTFRRVQLGSFEVTTLLDGTRPADGPHPIFGEDQSAEAVQALMAENKLPETRALFYFTPTIVNTGSELVLFDAGLGGDAGSLVSQLDAAGYTPDQIDIVVITHMHPDHIGGLMRDGAATFPNARYVTGQVEYDFWSAEDRLSGPTERVATLVQSNVVPLADQMTFLGDGDDVVSGITAVGAFGHTPGHMTFMIESDGQQILIWADTANHFVASIQRPDWHVRFDMDKEAAAETRKRLFDMAATDAVAVIGYHMPFPAIGYIMRTADSWRWEPLSYQLSAG
ncbi:MAG: MBL fold metallo-hydrolase [Pseudomonadota bacterium]